MQAIAALVLATTRYWDKQGLRAAPVIVAGAVLAILVVIEPVRENRKLKRESLSVHQHTMVSAALGRLVAEVQGVSRADIPQITAHVHVLTKKKFRQKHNDRELRRLERLVFNDAFPPTDITFTMSKGLIGACVSEKREKAADFVASKVAKIQDERSWNGLTDDKRQGLSWEDQRQLLNRKYGGLLAEPVRDEDGQVIGVVSLGIGQGLEANLQAERVKKAMGTAATDVSRALASR